MSLLEANLQVLYRRHPHLRRRGIESSRPPFDFQAMETHSGSPTARVRGLYLHSRYDPVKEARRIVGVETAGTPSSAVLLGFGLGYLAEAFYEAFPGTPLLVVEKEPGLFRQALASRDLRKLLSAPEIVWCIGEQVETVAMSAEQLPLKNMCILPLRPLVAADQEYYRSVETLLFSVLDRREVNINTLRRFGQLWVRNLLSNLGYFVGHPGIRAGRELFSGIPALVVGAGPSLEDVLPHLSGLRERLLIVAVDTSYRFCRSAGVEPDFLVTVDPQYWNSRHLDWLPRSGTVLISESSAHPRVFRGASESEEIYFVSSFFPLGRHIEQTIGERGLIGAGGSVATTAWDLCRYLGCSAIYMAGLDLGFPEKKTHARGAFFEENTHTCSCRLLPSEQMCYEYLVQAHPTALKNNAGSRTLTDRRMLVYKSWFENQLRQQAQAGGPATYSLAAEAVAVEGMEYVPVNGLLGLPLSRGRIETALLELSKRGRRMLNKQRCDTVLVSLQGLADELERLERLAGRGVELSSGGHLEVIPALEEVDRKIMALASRQIAGFLFQHLIHGILDNPAGAGSLAEALATSRKLYLELEDSARYHGWLLRRSIERIQAGGSSRIK
jgi:hypothetical protein